MTDWSIRKDAVVGVAAANRTLCLLPVDLSGTDGFFEMSVDIKSAGKARRRNRLPGFGSVGKAVSMIIAMVLSMQPIGLMQRSDQMDASSLVTKSRKIPLVSGKAPVTLKLTGHRVDDTIKLLLSATIGSREVIIAEEVPLSAIVGGISLLG